MEKVEFNSGIKEYQVNDNAVLRFNPLDPSLYTRFLEILGDIEAIGREMEAAAPPQDEVGGTDDRGIPIRGKRLLTLMCDCDARIKERLAYAFGADNDFDKIFSGVNAMAVTNTGEWVITNFINAVQPLIETSAQRSLAAKAERAVQSREQRRAALHG